MWWRQFCIESCCTIEAQLGVSGQAQPPFVTHLQCRTTARTGAASLIGVLVKGVITNLPPMSIRVKVVSTLWIETESGPMCAHLSSQISCSLMADQFVTIRHHHPSGIDVNITRTTTTDGTHRNAFTTPTKDVDATHTAPYTALAPISGVSVLTNFQWGYCACASGAPGRHGTPANTGSRPEIKTPKNTVVAISLQNP